MGSKKAVIRAHGTVVGPRASKLVDIFAGLTLTEQESVLADLGQIYAHSKEQRAAQLIAELKELGIDSVTANRATLHELPKAGIRSKSAKAGVRSKSTKVGLRSKVEPKYRSKIDPHVTWSGRGMMPKWMMAEMNGTEFKKEDFAIG